MIELNKIYNEDCLVGLKKIPDKSVNLIAIDPPYNIGKADWDLICKLIGKYDYKLLLNKYMKSRYIFNNQNLPSVWQHEPIKQNGHTTPKPIEILKNIILTSSNEGDTILDCFMGSGSTAIACIYTNRNYIGFELNKNYYTIAKNRIDTCLENNKLHIN
ncbi:DNA-methyltransferase [Clostridium rectalis]|uniref:DNA-methyltransferase n=1 Tax=Clostridium rectalis TaxID=2040295 RepID=UPI000F6385CE|nr:site-specific DNA-methyltransferase [Clostridium rectalis]